ncbi:MAG TPA: cytochrome c oxidase assembly factor Coa1 family protein [Candidatus Eisenbacteria bacterium]|nr:cytochrome c oxidase assembly factor Coa1 family protein [Candidatus Eisenbacteria bacterium]
MEGKPFAFAQRWLPRRFLRWLLAALLLGTLVPVVVQFAARRSDAYRLAVETAHEKSKFTDVLGEPVTEGWFFEGKTELGNPRTTEMLIPVRGRMKSGNLRATAIKDGGHWRLTQLILELTRPDEHIDLLAKAPI